MNTTTESGTSPPVTETAAITPEIAVSVVFTLIFIATATTLAIILVYKTRKRRLIREEEEFEKRREILAKEIENRRNQSQTPEEMVIDPKNADGDSVPRKSRENVTDAVTSDTESCNEICMMQDNVLYVSESETVDDHENPSSENGSTQEKNVYMNESPTSNPGTRSGNKNTKENDVYMNEPLNLGSKGFQKSDEKEDGMSENKIEALYTVPCKKSAPK